MSKTRRVQREALKQLSRRIAARAMPPPDERDDLDDLPDDELEQVERVECIEQWLSEHSAGLNGVECGG